jgi:hypothetical protein
MIEQWQKQVNSEWFTNLKENILKEGGTWMWPDAGFRYVLKEGKFVGESEEADDALKAILPDNDPNV